MEPAPETAATPAIDFIRRIVAADLAAGEGGARVVTRFPPEPNGYLHIGHAKSMCLNFGIAGETGGLCRLRFDDTNPLKESREYALAIEDDVRWLGFDWEGEPRHASDYFEEMYDHACRLIQAGFAFVDSQSAAEIRETRGTLTRPGQESPWRDRPARESVDLFARMRAGEFPDGAHVLRARIDMASGNLNLRDPVLYRIRHATHPHTGDSWCIYPTYDFAQVLSDAIEGVTHSLCTLEFEDHRPLYEWILDHAAPPARPRQIEFSRLNLEHTVMSKRRLAELVDEGHVDGWSDPRMPTLRGMRRRGYPPAAIRQFCERVGITRKESRTEMDLLERCVRDELDRSAPRAMAVLRPLRLVIDNWPEGSLEAIEALNHPRDPGAGTRTVPFGRELLIERDDFMAEPAPGFRRLAPGREVRLRYGYIVRCESFETDPATGAVSVVHCTYDPATRGGRAPDGRKVRGTIHWVSAERAQTAVLRLYDRLYRIPAPSGPEDLNPRSLEVIEDARIEPSLAAARPGERFQFERLGYFCRDDDLGFNRTVTLRDGWARKRAG